MKLPDQIAERVKQGKVVLFLGSGALVNAVLPNKEIPLGDGLRDILADKFLDDSFKQHALSHVADMAISNSSLFTVQDYIRDYFFNIQPAKYHELIPQFSWRAIFTTNYDLLVETVYEKSATNHQELVRILSNSDSFDETRLTTDKLPYLKLHGCISRTHDSNLPLILTTDQYNDYLENRKRLFAHLYELAYEKEVVGFFRTVFQSI